MSWWRRGAEVDVGERPSKRRGAEVGEKGPSKRRLRKLQERIFEARLAQLDKEAEERREKKRQEYQEAILSDERLLAEMEQEATRLNIEKVSWFRRRPKTN